jgi:stearoyl-CoA desaturase (delta-9 desaturase)
MSARTADARLLAGFAAALPLAATVLPLMGAVAAVAHAAVYGLNAGSIVAFAVMYTVTMLGITVGYHRLLAHRSFEAPAPVRALLVCCGSMAFLGPAIWWAALHRKHHQTTDTAADPHTPYRGGPGRTLAGFWFAHVGWMFAAAKGFKSGNFLEEYGREAPDLLADRPVFRGHMRYYPYVALGQLLPALIGWAFGDALQGWLWGGLLRTFVVSHLIWSVNSVTHLIGRRPFEANDQSTNFAPVALLTFGEGWHNNHHAFPRSVRFGLRRRELDVGGLVVRALALAGWASKLRVPDQAQLAAKRVAVKSAR